MPIAFSTRSFASACFVVAALAILTADVAGQTPVRPKGLSGVYLAVDAGWQNIIGGALVSGIDVLRQDRRRVATVSVGGRFQTSFGTLFGAELGLGFADGNLEHVDPSGPLTVRYRNRRQSDWYLTAGQTLDGARRNLVYFYLSEVSRTFEVTVVEPTRTSAQRDEQGLLRFGGGFERAVTNHFSVRLTAGTSRGGFANDATNLIPRRLLDLTAGALIRL